MWAGGLPDGFLLSNPPMQRDVSPCLCSPVRVHLDPPALGGGHGREAFEVYGHGGVAIVAQLEEGDVPAVVSGDEVGAVGLVALRRPRIRGIAQGLSVDVRLSIYICIYINAFYTRA